MTLPRSRVTTGPLLSPLSRLCFLICVLTTTALLASPSAAQEPREEDWSISRIACMTVKSSVRDHLGGRNLTDKEQTRTRAVVEMINAEAPWALRSPLGLYWALHVCQHMPSRDRFRRAIRPHLVTNPREQLGPPPRKRGSDGSRFERPRSDQPRSEPTVPQRSITGWGMSSEQTPADTTTSGRNAPNR